MLQQQEKARPMEFDKRITPARDDLAAVHLKGKVKAAAYAEGRAHSVTAASAPLRRAPASDAPLDTELLFGEGFTVYEECEGWAWGQAASDDYVGYVPYSALSAGVPHPTHWVKALRAYVFPKPDFKAPPLALISLCAPVEVTDRGDKYAQIRFGGGDGFVPACQLAALGDMCADYVETAERLVGTPYLWGGRQSLGLDCSGLVQISLKSAGIDVPRDADLQEQAVGTTLPLGADGGLPPLQRGDLVFWKGHVGIMVSPTHMVNANATYMAVTVNELIPFAERVAPTDGPIRTVKRV